MSPSFLNHHLQGMGFDVIYDPSATEFFGELPMSIWESPQATVASQTLITFRLVTFRTVHGLKNGIAES